MWSARARHTLCASCARPLCHVGLDWQEYVVVDPQFYRPAEVDLLVSDPAKAKRVLGWEPKVRFRVLVQMMVDADLALLKNEFGL